MLKLFLLLLVTILGLHIDNCYFNWKLINNLHCFIAPLVAGVEPTVQTVDFGRSAVFTCNYDGNPVKTVSWLKDGKKISGHDGSVLKIDSVRKEDKGMYQCFVRNEQESAQSSAELKLGSRCKLHI